MAEGTVEKFFFPVGALAGVLAVYFWLKKPAVPAQANQPSAAPSGVPNYTPEAQQYQVNPSTYTPSPLVLLSDPFSNKPAGTTNKPAGTTTEDAASQKPPYYLAFNFGPSHDLTKVPMQPKKKDSGACGCKSSCDTCSQAQNTFPDGTGATKMSSNRRRQIEVTPPGAWDNVINNIQSGDFGPITPFHPYLPPVGPNTETPAAPSQNIAASFPGKVTAKYVGPPLPYEATLSHSFSGLSAVGNI
jgi:hypothetical protein